MDDSASRRLDQAPPDLSRFIFIGVQSRFQCNWNACKMLRMRYAEGLINWTNAGRSR